MFNWKTCVCLLIGVVASERSVAFENEFREASVTIVDSTTLMVDGFIGLQTAEKMKNLLNPKMRRLIVRSEGGVTKTALLMAELIQDNHLDVTVRDYCVSSCANYLFVAGNKKVVERNSFVAWHGGHSHTPFTADIADAKALSAQLELLRREQRLYTRAGVSLDLIVYSGIVTTGLATTRTETVNVMGKSITRASADREYTDWVPTPTTLRNRLGMRGIVSYWHPGSANKARLVALSHGFKISPYVGEKWLS